MVVSRNITPTVNFNQIKMNRFEVIDVLRSLGLSDYESKAYSALLFLGHSKASNISREAEVPQSKIYEILDRLTEKKLVEVYAVRPKEFKSISPEVTLTGMIQEKETEINQIKNKVSSLLELLNSASIGTEVFEGIWTSKEKGWGNFFKRTCEMYNRSKSYVYVVTKNFSWSSKLAESLRACVKRGVEIKSLCTSEIDESNYHRVKWFHDNGVEIRFLRTKLHPSLIDVDCEEVLLRLDASPTQKKKFVFTSIYSRDVSLVKVLDTYVKDLWKRAKPLRL